LRFFGALPFELVVLLTGSEKMVLEEASVLIVPTSENGCIKQSNALSWNVQRVPHIRLTETPSNITERERKLIRGQIAACVDE
jgi:hypothetical protein